MLAPPALYGGFASRIVWLVLGLFLCSCGIVCFLESELGLPPWDVLHQGLAEQLGISFGAANLIVSLAVLILVYGIVMNRTVFGRHIYAIGGNRHAAELSGINTRRVDFWLFVNMGVLAAIAGVARRVTNGARAGPDTATATSHAP